MRDIYLTKKRKKRYMEDFTNNVLKFDKIKIWKLDEGLPEILSSINSNDYIQTLYSKKDSFNKPDNQHLNYLEICYSSRVELSLFRNIIPIFFVDINKYFESKFYYIFNLPRLNQNHLKHAEPSGLGCLDDKKYFLY